MQTATSRRDFLKLAGLGMMGSVLAGCGTAQQNATASQPNIVLIMADDMGYSDIGCFGGDIDTPNLDTLAENGLRFTSFYNTCRCCPTRAALLTGLYQHQAGMGWMTYETDIPGYRGDLNDRCVTIAEALRPAGYNTYMHGKWHVTTHYGQWYGDTEHSSKHNWPLQRGFDRFYGIIDGTSNYFQPFSLVRDNEPEPMDMSPDYYFTDAVSDHCVECIEQTPADTPLFSYVAYTAPHFPLHAFEEDIAKYHGRFDDGWDVLRERKYRRMLDMGVLDPSIPLSDRDEQVNSWADEEHKAHRLRAMEVYAAQVDRMDRGIGRIVDALRRTGRLENTVICYFSDNGAQSGGLNRQIGDKRYTPLFARDGRPMKAGNRFDVMPGGEDTYQAYDRGWANLSDVPYRKFKGWAFEGGIASPLIVHWPAGIAGKGEFRRQIGHVMDMMPTCCELAGAEYPREFNGKHILPTEGVSLVPAIADNPVVRGPLFWEHENDRAVRDGDWKLVAPSNGGWELYNLADDPCELHDLSADQPGKVAEMEAMYDAWTERCGVLPWSEVSEVRLAAQQKVDALTAEWRARQE